MFDEYNIISSLKLRKTGSHYWAGSCPLCGGKDRFVLKLNNKNEYVWHCRHCHSDGYHTLAYLNYKLTGEWAKESIGSQPRIHTETPVVEEPQLPINDAQWQDEVVNLVWEAGKELSNPQSELGEKCRQYLRSRGLNEGTWHAFLLGATIHKGQPAIVIPYFDSKEVFTAVKFRFIEPQNGLRYIMLKGSKTSIFYGLNAVAHRNDLIIVEGEFNCLSLWQATRGLGVDVISTGSKGYASLVPLLKVISRQYVRVFVWLDDVNEAMALGKELGTSRVIHSLEVEGRKLDANAMLQEGTLAEFWNLFSV